MDVGNDPFPRDEVTGLAAFENLEPVSGLDVLPEEPAEIAAQPVAARTFNRPLGVSPVRAGIAGAPGAAIGARAPTTPRPEDKTEILSLEKVEQLAVEDDTNWEEEATSILQPGALRNLGGEPRGQLRGQAAGRPVLGASPPPAATSSPPAAALQMEWDEDEPPTRMRDDLPFLPPLGGGPGPHGAEWDHDDGTPDRSHAFEDVPTTALGPVDLPPAGLAMGRPSPFPTTTASGRTYLAPIEARAPKAERGGAPSPFTATSAGAETWEKAAPATRPPWMLALAGAVGALLLVLLGRALFGSSADATVTIVTSPADANVFIDGKKSPGTASPYMFGELAEGPHELVVQKEGYIEYRSSFKVDGSESSTLPTVELVSKKRDTGFAINSLPSGAEIVIDGVPAGKLTPAQVTGVSPGVHKIELRLGGVTGYELQVLVPENTVLQLPMAELEKGGKLAEASAEEADEPATRRRSRARSDDDADDTEHASAPRREPREPREPRESPAPDDEPAARREPAAASGAGGGMLRLNSRPWSQVYVDGRMVGNTPQMGLPLSPGSHSIRLVNQQMGLSKTFSVSIKPGQMVTKIVDLVE
jgi:eukaryotic-like serine/threonine-protein kinase